MHRAAAAIGILAILGTSSCNQSTEDASITGTGRASAPNRPARDLAEDDGQWLMAPKDYASTRFSGLTEITTENIRTLQLAWSFSTGVLNGHEAAPLVVGDTMYVVTPYPNILYALDLADQPGRVRWKYEPKPLRAAQGVACCDGFENHLAQLVAREMNATVRYTWWAQRRGFVRNTLRAADCDVVMGDAIIVRLDCQRTGQRYAFLRRQAAVGADLAHHGLRTDAERRHRAAAEGRPHGPEGA